jgi:hypothetical protein
MGNRLVLPLDTWIAELKAEPVSLANAATPSVKAATVDAADEIRSAYPRAETGNLKAGVVVRQDTEQTDPAVASSVVVSSAPHAHLYEYGTRVARANPTFWPITARLGRVMNNDVAAVLRSRGYQVTGALD